MTSAVSRLLAYILSPALVAFLATLAFPACDGEATPEGGVITEMLRLVPDDGADWTRIEVGDVARFREAAGIEVPDRDLDASAYVALLMSQDDVPNPGVAFFGGNYRVGDMAEMARRYLGFGLVEVEQWLVFSSSTPADRTARGAIRGSFAPDQVEDLIAACDGCPSAQTVDHRGTRIYAWDDNFESRPDRRLTLPLFDSAGQGGAVAIQERHVFRAYSRDAVLAMIDAQAGERSLADDESFWLAGQSLDRLRALGAVITDFSIDREFAEQLTNAWPPDDPRRAAWVIGPDTTLLRPYAVLGFGAGYANATPFAAVVLVHRTEDDAAANRELLRRRLREAVVLPPGDGTAETWVERVDRIDFEVDGRVLSARLWLEVLPESWKERTFLEGEEWEHLFIHE